MAMNRSACAVPVNFGSRKLLAGVPFDGQAYANRYTQYTSIDVEIMFTGDGNSSIMQLSRPGQWNGYLAVQMAQQNITVSAFNCPAQACQAF